MYRAVNDLILPTAKAMGDGHACAYGQTDEEVDEQTGNGTGGAHCGDGHAAAELPHHHEISRVEQQLQKTGQNNGDGILDDVRKQRPFQHVSVRLIQKGTFFLLAETL